MRFKQLDNTHLTFDRKTQPFWTHEVAYALYDLRSDEELTEAKSETLEFEIAAWESRGGRP